MASTSTIYRQKRIQILKKIVSICFDCLALQKQQLAQMNLPELKKVFEILNKNCGLAVKTYKTDENET